MTPLATSARRLKRAQGLLSLEGNVCEDSTALASPCQSAPLLPNSSPLFGSGSLSFQKSQYAYRPLFHLLCLCGGLIKPRLKLRPSMFPSHLDGGFHTVGKDDELRRPAVIMRAKANDAPTLPQCAGNSPGSFHREPASCCTIAFRWNALKKFAPIVALSTFARLDIDRNSDKNTIVALLPASRRGVYPRSLL